MAGKLTRWIELSANVAIIIVAVLLGIVLFKHYFLTVAPTPDLAGPPGIASPRPGDIAQPGARLSLRDVNWDESQRTLLLALSSKCHYCTESAQFYRRLAEARARHNGTRLIAVLPQEVSQGQDYLNKLEVKVDDVKQTSLASVGVSGTPTLILVDSQGRIVESWVGKLPPDQEDEVLDRLLAERAGR